MALTSERALTAGSLIDFNGELVPLQYDCFAPVGYVYMLDIRERELVGWGHRYVGGSQEKVVDLRCEQAHTSKQPVPDLELRRPREAMVSRAPRGQSQTGL